MKRFSVFFVKAIFALILCACFLGACGKNKPAEDALDSDTSYAFGMLIGLEYNFDGLDVDYDALTSGFRDATSKKKTRYTRDEAMSKFDNAIAAIMARKAEKNKTEGEAFLAKNKERDGVVTTDSGLQYEVLTRGNGAKPAASNTVRVHYEGTLIDGTVFDSSYEAGKPIEFHLDRVIPGWIEGVQLMNVGSTYRFVIPSELAYGQEGMGGAIPPNATLSFKIELLAIVK